jgi:predicted site-specific integrase-resolvase
LHSIFQDNIPFSCCNSVIPKASQSNTTIYYKSISTSTKIPDIVRPVRSSGKANTKYTEGVTDIEKGLSLK